MAMDTNSNAVSRREILKRGAFVGGAVLWIAPAVQVVGMGSAFAKDVSPDCSRYCIKWDVDVNAETGELTCVNGGKISAYPMRGNTWEEMGSPGKGHSDGDGHGGSHDDDGSTALACPKDGVNDAEATHDLTNRIKRPFVVYGTQHDGFWIAFPNDIKLADLSDVGEASVGAKCGTTKVTFAPTVEADPCLKDPEGNPYRRIHVRGCGNGKDISHIELIVDWCSGGASS